VLPCEANYGVEVYANIDCDVAQRQSAEDRRRIQYEPVDREREREEEEIRKENSLIEKIINRLTSIPVA
jgi:hypothetical protein